jgi:hypothetical protein
MHLQNTLQHGRVRVSEPPVIAIVDDDALIGEAPEPPQTHGMAGSRLCLSMPCLTQDGYRVVPHNRRGLGRSTHSVSLLAGLRS